MHYLFALLWRMFNRKSWWESWSLHDEDCLIKLFTFNILLNQVELLSWIKLLNLTWVLEFNFSTQLDTFSKKFQLNSTLFESSTQPELRYSTWRSQSRLDLGQIEACSNQYAVNSLALTVNWLGLELWSYSILAHS